VIRRFVIGLAGCLAVGACGGARVGGGEDEARDAIEVTARDVEAEATTADVERDDSDVPEDGEEPAIGWHDELVGLPEGVRDLWASGPSDLWIVGDAGLAAHGGPDRWRQLDLRDVDPEPGALRGVFGPDEEHVWMVGDGGRVLRWSRASGRAERVPVSGAPSLRAVWGESEGAMWIVGGRAYPEQAAPVVLRATPDGATSWTLPSGLPTGAKLLDVWGTGPSDVWAVGESGLVLRWDGLVWSRVELPSGERLTAIAGQGGDLAIVGGSFVGVLYERRGAAGTFVESWPGGSPLEGVAYGADGALWKVGVNAHRALRASPEAAWTELASAEPSAWQDVWIDGRGDVWTVAGGLEGRVARRGPMRGDVPVGPLQRVEERPDPDRDADVEIVEASDVEVVETAPDGDAEVGPPEWPFVIGTLSPANVFKPLVAGQTMPLIHGPQGGFHIEVAVRFPWAGSETEIVAGLKLGLWFDGTRQAVYETSGYPFAAIGDGLFQTFIVAVMFDCIFTAAACTSTDFDGRLGRLEIGVEPPGRAWSGALELVLEDTW